MCNNELYICKLLPSEQLFPSAVLLASNDLVFTDDNYSYSLVIAARNGVTDVIFIT